MFPGERRESDRDHNQDGRNRSQHSHQDIPADLVHFLQVGADKKRQAVPMECSQANVANQIGITIKTGGIAPNIPIRIFQPIWFTSFRSAPTKSVRPFQWNVPRRTSRIRSESQSRRAESLPTFPSGYSSRSGSLPSGRRRQKASGRSNGMFPGERRE